MRLCFHVEGAGKKRVGLQCASAQRRRGWGNEPVQRPKMRSAKKLCSAWALWDDIQAVQTSNPTHWAHHQIKHTGSIAKVGRQEGGCQMDCRLKTRDGHYQMALGAMRSSLYLNQWSTAGSCTRQLPPSAVMHRGLVGLSAAHVVRHIRSSLQHYVAPHRSPSFLSIFWPILQP